MKGKIKASAMYYALFLSVVFALILAAFIAFANVNRSLALQLDVQEQLVDNALSGIAYAEANYTELKFNQPEIIPLFGIGTDSVEVMKKQWGLFGVIYSRAFHKKAAHTKIAMVGEYFPENTPALVVADHGRPISICGNTRLEGTCFLPKAGVKRAYIAGQNYNGSELVYGNKRIAEKHLPELRPTLLKEDQTEVQGLENWDGGVDSLVVSFAGEGLHIVDDRFIAIHNQVISGQVKIEARDSVFIGADAQIENAIVQSRIVHVEAGFTGSLQVFASEKIVLENDVTLRYPSVLGLVEEDVNLKAPLLEIGPKSRVIGTVLVYSKEPDFRRVPLLTVHQDAQIDGMVYSQGKTQLKGTVNGTLYTDKFYLKTTASVYENHILNGRVIQDLPEGFVGANLLEETDQLKQMAWLH